MYIVADVGGTKTRIAASTDLNSFSEPVIVPTPADYDAGLAHMKDSMLRVAGGEAIQCVSVGLPGVLSRDKRSLRTIANLPSWNNRDFADDIENAVGGATFLENDADQVGLGEAVYGAGKGASIVAYLTVSTGVGGTRIVDGEIDRSFDGYEPGGQYVSMHEPLRNLEDMISGKAIHKRSGIHPEQHGKAHPIWPELAKILGFGIHNAIVFWSPERVVIGGSIMSEVGIQIDAVRDEVARILTKFPTAPEIVHASLGDVGGLWGGMARLRQLKL